MAALSSKILRTCAVIHQQAPNSISVHHWHFKYNYCIGCIIWFMWQSILHSSLDLLQSLLLVWDPLKISSFSGHLVNGLENYTEMRLQNPKRPLGMCFFFGCLKDQMQQLSLHFWRYISHFTGLQEVSLRWAQQVHFPGTWRPSNSTSGTISNHNMYYNICSSKHLY